MLLNEKDIRFTLLDHLETKQRGERSFDILVSLEVKEKSKETFKMTKPRSKVWLVIHCSSPGSYTYSFDSTEDVSEIELTDTEERYVGYYVSQNNLILDEADRLGIELDSDDRYHWGLQEEDEDDGEDLEMEDN
jgi:hypothetical protein